MICHNTGVGRRIEASAVRWMTGGRRSAACLCVQSGPFSARRRAVGHNTIRGIVFGVSEQRSGVFDIPTGPEEPEDD